MKWKIKKSEINGTLQTPPSKSHTIRALLIATLARGTSVIHRPLMDGDGKSALDAACGLGARCRTSNGTITVAGVGGDLSGGQHELFLGNSGTSTRLFSAAAALGNKPRRFDGDNSLRSRPMKPLLRALADLGAHYDIESENGDIPFTIHGPLQGGVTTVSGLSSQYLSSLLLTAPLLPQPTTIHVTDLHEKPYVEMTLWWLDRMGIAYEISDSFTTFRTKANQKYRQINEHIPGDFSSATFGAVAAAVAGDAVTIQNLDFTDLQGDKEIFAILRQFGVPVVKSNNSVTIQGKNRIQGRRVDLNETPDALPALSVLGCYAQGRTELVNVAQARIKETDRIAVMTQELRKMGACIEELDDGVVVHQSTLKGCVVDGHGDHRVVMALAVAGMFAEGETVITTAESASVTYPCFVEEFQRCGAHISLQE